MNVFCTIDQDGKRPIVHVAGKFAATLCPGCSRPSATTNGTGWREVIDVVRTLVVTLSICVRRFVCEYEDCNQRTFDERFEGIGRGGATDRALAFFTYLQRGRAIRNVGSDNAPISQRNIFFRYKDLCSKPCTESRCPAGGEGVNDVIGS
jgi:hypothetical protein